MEAEILPPRSPRGKALHAGWETRPALESSLKKRTRKDTSFLFTQLTLHGSTRGTSTVSEPTMWRCPTDPMEQSRHFFWDDFACQDMQCFSHGYLQQPGPYPRSPECVDCIARCAMLNFHDPRPKMMSCAAVVEVRTTGIPLTSLGPVEVNKGESLTTVSQQGVHLLLRQLPKVCQSGSCEVPVLLRGDRVREVPQVLDKD